MFKLAVLVALAVSTQVDRVVELIGKMGDGDVSHMSERVDCRGRQTRLEPAPSLSLTIVGLDSHELSMGGTFVVDIRVKNTGATPAVLPSVLSSDFGARFSLPPYALQASLGISAVDAQGRRISLSGTVLRGSPGRIGTTETLRPGESLTLRFPGAIAAIGEPGIFPTGDARLSASLILGDNACRDWQPVSSPPVDVFLRGSN